MPLYEYECEKCQEIFELQVRMNEENIKCIYCGNDVKKLVSKNSFRLKGQDWYKPSQE